ncbi:MAG: protein translocase subunit SecF [Pseudomonadales bacterium]|nr:protein translocase subunit SecF [Pseudomonadales bacterium]
MKEFDFMGKRKLAAAFSILLLIISIASLAVQQLSLGLDFTGGTLIEVGYQHPANLSEIRRTLKVAGYDDAVVQNYGKATDVLVRLAPHEGEKESIANNIVEVLNNNTSSDVTLRRVEFVGPQVGDELRDQSGIAMIVALGVMMIYILFRFHFKFSVGAVAALFHDVIITLGFFSIFHIPFDLTVLAAVLAVIGYSLNDTIVVSDRIRENFHGMRKGDALTIINVSLSQTLGRTLITSLTTLLVLLALFVFGGELIKGFSIALMVGVVVGTYSSIYVASNILLFMGICKEDFIHTDSEVVDDRP